MNPFLVTLHIVTSVLLIGAVLLQPGAKGGGLGASFGGGGANSAFGARGAAPILAKLTYWLAGIFLATSLTIEIVIVKNERSIIDKRNSAKPTNVVPPVPPPLPPAPPVK